jgi:hypothetical protein
MLEVSRPAEFLRAITIRSRGVPLARRGRPGRISTSGERMKLLAPRALVVVVLAATALVVPAAPAAAAGLTITGRHALIGDTPGSVVLVGQYSCGPYPAGVPDRGVIDLEIRQEVDGVPVNAIGYLEPRVCDGELQWYAAELLSFAGSLVLGAARWSGSGYVEGPGGMQHVHVPPARIRIR